MSTKRHMTTPTEPVLIVNDAHGIYCPQIALELLESWSKESDHINVDLSAISPEDLTTVRKGPDEEWYWEAWSNIEYRAKIQINGGEFYIYQNGDVWLVPTDFENEEFFP